MVFFYYFLFLFLLIVVTPFNLEILNVSLISSMKSVTNFNFSKEERKDILSALNESDVKLNEIFSNVF